MGESKSISTFNMGTFVAVRMTGSNALAPAGERDVRPAWPAVEDVPEEEEPRERGSECQGECTAATRGPIPFCYTADS
jgi:hypothetical protein